MSGYRAHKYRCDDPTCPQMLCTGTTTRLPMPAARSEVETAQTFTPEQVKNKQVALESIVNDYRRLLDLVGDADAEIMRGYLAALAVEEKI